MMNEELMMMMIVLNRQIDEEERNRKMKTQLNKKNHKMNIYFVIISTH